MDAIDAQLERDVWDSGDVPGDAWAGLAAGVACGEPGQVLEHVLLVEGDRAVDGHVARGAMVDHAHRGAWVAREVAHFSGAHAGVQDDVIVAQLVPQPGQVRCAIAVRRAKDSQPHLSEVLAHVVSELCHMPRQDTGGYGASSVERSSPPAFSK